MNDTSVEPQPKTPGARLAYGRLIARYLRDEKPRVILLAGLLAATIGLQLYVPQLIRSFIDLAAGGRPAASLLRLAGIFIGLALLRELANAAVTYVGQDLRWRSTNVLRADLTRHCLALGMDFHNGQTPGTMIERVDGDVTALSNLMSDYFLRVVGNVLILVGVLVLLWREDMRLGLAYSAFVLLTFLALRRAATVAVPAWKQAREASAELFGFLEERLAGTEDIRASGAEGWVLQRFLHRHRDYMQVRRRAGLLGSAIWVGTIALFTLGSILALGMGAWLYQAGAISLGTVYLVFHYTEMLRGPIEQLSHQLEDLQRAGGGLERVAELLAQPLPIEPAPERATRLPSGALSLDFEAVRFGYQPAEPVLQGLDFALAPGQVLGLLGRTGSGKTTLSRLLFRLYDIDAGRIRIGGVDLRDTRRAELRRRVGIVTQDVQLFNASVRDNLSFFEPDVPDARILEVLEDVGLGGWLAGLPAGLDTELETGGKGLSAGEGQLLAFARVFLRDPGLVVLDEASSRLDPATEQRIERAVDRLLAGRTGIVIAHRLGTVQRCDQIMILSDGRIVEHGDRVALMTKPDSRFTQLLRAGMEEVLA